MLAKTCIHPESRAIREAIEDREQGRDKLAALSFDQNTKETSNVKTEGDRGCASAGFVYEHIGDTPIESERDGSDFTLVEVGIFGECGRNDGGIFNRDEGGKSQSDKARVGHGFALKL